MIRLWTIAFLLGTAALVYGADQPFDKVIWHEAKLYVVLTDPGDHEAHRRLVIRHAAAALEAAKPYAKKKFNIVFIIRDTPESGSGISTGFSTERLQAIANAPPAEAKKLVWQHAWSHSVIPK